MGLFERKSNFGSSGHLYSSGLSKTVLIVGLGNIGAEYEGTRHNIGFAAMDALATAIGAQDWHTKKDLHCQLALGNAGESRVIIIKPTTFMNNSGQAVRAVMQFYKINPQNILVVHDELDVPFGEIRTKVGGGSAGHNGIKSVIEHCGEDFGRVRIGIGPKLPAQMDGADFVLARFSKEQQTHMKHLLQESTALLTEYAFSGILPGDTRSFII